MPLYILGSLSTSQDKHSQVDGKVPIGSFLQFYIIMTSTVLDKSYEYIWKSHLNVSQFRLSYNQSVITTDGLSLALARVVTVTLSAARLRSTLPLTSRCPLYTQNIAPQHYTSRSMVIRRFKSNNHCTHLEPIRFHFLFLERVGWLVWYHWDDVVVYS